MPSTQIVPVSQIDPSDKKEYFCFKGLRQTKFLFFSNLRRVFLLKGLKTN